MILWSAMVALFLVAHHPRVDARGRLYYDPRAVERGGASTSQMGRFETELLASDDNLRPRGFAGHLDRPRASVEAAEDHRA